MAATTPIYLQESSVLGSGRQRTKDTMILVLLGIGGISAATWFDYGMLKAPDHEAWRAALTMQAFFLTVALVLVYGCPDSPRLVPYSLLLSQILPQIYYTIHANVYLLNDEN